MVVLPGLYELVKDGATHITRLQYDESEIALGHNPLSFMGVEVYDMYLNPLKTITHPSGVAKFQYVDQGRDSYPLTVTQTLFDDDEAYEFFAPIRESNDRYASCIGLRLMKDDGSTITTIHFGENQSLTEGALYDGFSIMRFYDDRKCEEVFYLKVDLYNDNDYSHFTRYYSFEQGKIATSLKQVRDVKHPIKATPSLPKNNEQVTVDLGEMKSPQMLNVVNANGTVVTRMPLTEGQKQATVSTQGLPAGMYIIRVSDGKNETENCKIIIR